MYNPGKIIKKKGKTVWQTKTGPFELNLDIIAINPKNAIASFVVMEQDQNFLNYCGAKLAESINKKKTKPKVLMVTVESKGSHFIPWVWSHLKNNAHHRIISLRKGKPKVYMNNPPAINYQSITSPNQQNLILSNKDNKLLNTVDFTSYQLILVDDFIGKGGTISAVCRLFKQLRLPEIKFAAVIGSDGNLYQQTFQKANLNLEIVPNPLLVQLPTFCKPSKNSPWEINE